jgi:hypothetical protein
MTKKRPMSLPRRPKELNEADRAFTISKIRIERAERDAAEAGADGEKACRKLAPRPNRSWRVMTERTKRWHPLKNRKSRSTATMMNRLVPAKSSRNIVADVEGAAGTIETKRPKSVLLAAHETSRLPTFVLEMIAASKLRMKLRKSP